MIKGIGNVPSSDMNKNINQRYAILGEIQSIYICKSHADISYVYFIRQTRN